MLRQETRVKRPVSARHDAVRHEVCVLRRLSLQQHHPILETIKFPQTRFDFSQFNPMPSEFDLPVGAT